MLVRKIVNFTMNNGDNRIYEDVAMIERVARRIFAGLVVRVERALGGTSTLVYRIAAGGEIFYMRIQRDASASFASEVAIHTRLRQMQVKVPEVVYCEDRDEMLQRPVMVTTEIKGTPVIQSRFLGESRLREIVMEAGRELALINSVAVDGFGWLRGQEPLHGPQRVYRDFVLGGWQANVEVLAKHVLSTKEVALLEGMLARYGAWLDLERGQLAHGDFSNRHIYQSDGQYAGMIDFGDSKGAGCWHDLAHYHIRDGGRLPWRLESALLRGYGEVTSLPSIYEQYIRFTGVLLNVQLLVHGVQKLPLDRDTLHLLYVLRQDLRALR